MAAPVSDEVRALLDKWTVENPWLGILRLYQQIIGMREECREAASRKQTAEIRESAFPGRGHTEEVLRWRNKEAITTQMLEGAETALSNLYTEHTTLTNFVRDNYRHFRAMFPAWPLRCPDDNNEAVTTACAWARQTLELDAAIAAEIRSAPSPPEWSDYLGVADWQKIVFPGKSGTRHASPWLQELEKRTPPRAEKRSNKAWRIAKAELTPEQLLRLEKIMQKLTKPHS